MQELLSILINASKEMKTIALLTFIILLREVMHALVVNRYSKQVINLVDKMGELAGTSKDTENAIKSIEGLLNILILNKLKSEKDEDT